MRRQLISTFGEDLAEMERWYQMLSLGIGVMPTQYLITNQLIDELGYKTVIWPFDGWLDP